MWPLLLSAQILFTPVPTAPPFTLNHNPTSDKHMVETMAGGIAVFDYNRDGRPDLFFTNGASLPDLKTKHPNRLYRNDGNWRFTDVTAEADLSGEGYSLGAAAADFDNDGHTDLFVAGLYSNHLYRNLGNGKFEELKQSGIRSSEWSVAAGWFDFDNDGRLDLLVTNYGRIDLSKPRFCGDQAKALRVYCHPRYYDPRPNQLYRNLGNGKFEDVSSSSGIAKSLGRGMSIAFADYDADGKLDVFITNDNLPNFLFHNLGNGKFEEVALLAGVALLDNGKPVASMGTDFRDYDNDGKPDLIVTALNGETFPLFHNEGNGSFADHTLRSQIGRLSNGYSGWGVAFADFDNDGLKDIFTANSHVNDLVEKFEAATYKQANTIFRNRGQGKFEAAATGLESVRAAHRGAVLADFDGDGKLDIAVSVLGEKAELWRNTSPTPNNYLAIRLTGKKSNRDAIGAILRINTQSNLMSSSVSYASSIHTPIYFGLGTAKLVEKLEILWPSGKKQTLLQIPSNQLLQVTEPD
jgi:enediyne biosynthesis protein E4